MKPATSKLHQPAMVIASHSYMASIWLLYGYICCYQQGTNLSEQAIWTTHALRMVWVWDPQLHQLHQNHHFPCAPVEEVAMCRAKCSLLSEPGWLEPWHQQVPKYTLVKAKCWNPKLVLKCWSNRPINWLLPISTSIAGFSWTPTARFRPWDCASPQEPQNYESRPGEIPWNNTQNVNHVEPLLLLGAGANFISKWWVIADM